MKAYTVTGATGYIGAKLIEHLSEDNLVYAVVRKTSELKIKNDNVVYVIYDGTESSLEVAVKNSDYIVHLGALYDTRDNEETIHALVESNIMFSMLLFNVVNRVNPDAIVSSASTFSSLDELGNYSPATFYAATKSAVETLAAFYKDLSIHFLTFPDTYGPGDWRPKIHNILARNESWPFEFKGNAKQEMKMLHIDDVIGHILSSMKDDSKGVHIHDIYSEGTLITLEELSKLITNKECMFNNSAEIVKIPHLPREMSKPTKYINKHKTIEFNL